MKKILFVGTIIFIYGNHLFAQPNTIPGLAIWLSADTGVTLFGGAVSQWNDLSGNGHHAIQATPSEQPMHILNIPELNNKPVVRFDGTEDILFINSGDTVWSAFVVVNWRGVIPFPQYNGIMSSQTFPPPNSILFMGLNGTSDLYVDPNDIIFAVSDYYVNAQQTTQLSPLDRYKIISGVDTDISDTAILTDFIIGRQSNNATRYWNGDIAEIIVYRTQLTLAERFQIIQYLDNKYAPPVNLGGDITVCSFPLTLPAHQDYYLSYLWSDASTADSLIVSAPGDYFVTVTDIFGINSIDTVSVFQDISNYTVNLPSDTSICIGTTLTLTAGPTHLLYQWSTGSTDNYISTDTSGTFYVSVTDCNSNISIDTVDVTVVPLPAFNLGNDTLICFNQPLLLDPGMGSSVSYLWSDSSTDSVLTVNSPGTYSLYVQDAIGCSYSDTIFILVDSALATASLGPDDSLCAGNVIALVTGAAAAQSYLWSDNSTAATLVVQSTGTYWVTVTDSNGCSIRDTIAIFINGVAPSVNFSALTVCLGDTTFFTDLTPASDTVIAWSWNFGEPSSGANNFSLLQNPWHIYADSGTYIVTLVDTSVSGCYNDTTITTRVYPNPVPGFTHNPSIACTGTPLQFNNGTDTVGYTVASWQWNFSDPLSGGNNFSSLKNPSHTFNTAGNFSVMLTVTLNNGCSVTDTIVVPVGLAVQPLFSFFNTCIGEVTNFFTSVSGASLLWNFGDNSFSTQQNPLHQYAFVQTYQCTLTAVTMAGCTTSVITPVMIHDLPVAHFRTPPACLDVPYQLMDSSYVSQGTVTQWQWRFPDFTTSAQQNPFYTFNDTLQYNITLAVTTNFGCKDSIILPVKAHPVPTASFASDVSYGDAPLPVDFSNLSSGAVSYLWDFGDTAGTSTVPDPSYTYTELGTYPVTLIASTAFGCTDTMLKYIFVLEPFLDLAVTSIDKTSGTNFISLSAGIANLGNIAVSDFKISAWLENSLPVFENWNGNLLPQSTLVPPYNFVANFEIPQINPPHVLCVEIIEANGRQDDNPDNNVRCINLDDDFVVIEPYPNPSEQVINLQVVVSRKDFLSISVYDAAGKLIREVYNGTATTGLNKFIFDISSLAEGTYFCKYTFSAKTIVKPLTHISKKKN